MTSLVAQSLDLPPSAARWRHHQRAMDSSLPGTGASYGRQRRSHSSGRMYRILAARVTFARCLRCGFILARKENKGKRRARASGTANETGKLLFVCQLPTPFANYLGQALADFGLSAASNLHGLAVRAAFFEHSCVHLKNRLHFCLACMSEDFQHVAPRVLSLMPVQDHLQTQGIISALHIPKATSPPCMVTWIQGSNSALFMLLFSAYAHARASARSPSATSMPCMCAAFQHCACACACSGSLQQQQQQRRIYDLPVSSSVLVDDEELEEWSDDSSEEVIGQMPSCTLLLIV
eukprot:scaffold40318_cov21-Tisochrysis_lutea.AAC.1